MLIPLSLALAFAAGQSAEAPAPAGQSQFIMVTPDGPTRDADGDGFVSRDEFMAPLAEAFGRLDKDGDGRLSEEERQSGHGHIRMRGPGPMAWRREGSGDDARTVIYEREGDGPGRLTINGRPVEGLEGVEIVTADGAPGGPGHVIMRRNGHADSAGERHTFTVDASADGAPRIMLNGRPVEGADGMEVVTAEGSAHGPGHVIIRRNGRADGAGERHAFTVDTSGEGEPRIMIDGREVEGGDANVIVRRMEGGPDGQRIILRQAGPDVDGEHHQIFVHRLGGPNEGGLDKDGDGKVSEEEFLAPMREAFRSMDADHSGALEDGEHGPAND